MSIFKILKKKDKKEQKTEAPVKREEIKKTQTSVKTALPLKKRVVRDILVKPLVSEKATFLGQYGQYIFEVTKKANKNEIAKAILDTYGVKPIKINIVNLRGKKVRYGRIEGKTRARKKAIITLKPGEKIEVYEKV